MVDVMEGVLAPERHQQLVDRVVVEQKRKELRTPGGMPVVFSYDHMARHIAGSGLLGASIEGWQTPEQMLLDEEVWGVVEKAVKSLNPKVKPGETRVFDHTFERIIGTENIIPLDQLPIEGASWWVDGREGYYVNVTDAKAPPTNQLNLMFFKKQKTSVDIFAA